MSPEKGDTLKGNEPLETPNRELETTPNAAPAPGASRFNWIVR
jgi:hypothetical protein